MTKRSVVIESISFYLTGHDQLIFLEVKNNVSHFTTETGKPCTIPCKPTHPNVAVDLFRGMIFELYEKV